jgi:hypothetical protein
MTFAPRISLTHDRVSIAQASARKDPGQTTVLSAVTIAFRSRCCRFLLMFSRLLPRWDPDVFSFFCS